MESVAHSRPTSPPPPWIGPGGVAAVLAAVVTVATADRPHVGRSAALLAAVAACTAAYQAATVLAAVAFGLRPDRVAVFYGGAIARGRFPGGYWSVGWLPVGGYVRLPGLAETDPPPRIDRPWPVRVGVTLAAPLVMLVVAALCLDPGPFAASVASVAGVVGRTAAAVGGHSTTGPIAAAWVARLDHDRLAATVARVAVLFGLVNLLPFPFLAGGQAAIWAIEGVSGRRLPPMLLGVLSLASIVGLLVADVPFYTQLYAAWRR